MQPLDLMKGRPIPLLLLQDQVHTLELVTYTDASYGIFRDGRNLGVWEPSEELDCVAALVSLAGLLSPDRTVWVPRPQSPEAVLRAVLELKVLARLRGVSARHCRRRVRGASSAILRHRPRRFLTVTRNHQGSLNRGALHRLQHRYPSERERGCVAAIRATRWASGGVL
jgi:hypothetical protein